MNITQNGNTEPPSYDSFYEVSDRAFRLIACIFCISFLFNILSSAAQSSSYAGTEIIINIQTDEFAAESEFQLIDGNSYEVLWKLNSPQLRNSTFYSDTLHFPIEHCFQFSATDRGGDGLEGEGFFQIISDGEIVIENKKFNSNYKNNFNCKESEVCELAINIYQGKELLKGDRNSWFEVRPIFDTYYSIVTLSECDTKIWIYEDCDSANPDDQTGALFYNDDYKDKNAGLNQILLKGGEKYLCRIETDEDCTEASYVEFIDLELRKGCMDPASCNFDPLANLESGDCEYGDCAPDLIINQEVLESSIYLDSIDNDSHCLIEEGCLHGYGKRDIIRFSTQIENIGTTDYIIGVPEEESNLFSEDNCHQHWHYLGYAEYLLFDGMGSPQPIGFKNGFCALDYRCQDEKSYKYSCDYMGISAGCYDTYDHDLLCQWIDVTDVPDGDYTVVVRVNYNRADDLYGRKEIQFENNWAQVCIRLDRSDGSLSFTKLPQCDIYRDCLNVALGNSRIDCNGVCGGDTHYGDIDEDGTVDSLDLLDYKQKLKDGVMPTGSCYDLTGDQKITSYDVLLLQDCLRSSPYDENSDNHTHCDFPKSFNNDKDSLYIRMDAYNREGKYLDLSYRSNVDFLSFDSQIDGAQINSVALLDSEIQCESLSFENQLKILLPLGEVFQKSADFIPFLRIYLKTSEGIQVCLNTESQGVNMALELVHTVIDNSCVDLNTTANNSVVNSGEFFLYPNPVKDGPITLKNFANLKNPKTTIYAGNGLVINKEITLSKQGKMNITELNSGLYFVKISSEGQSFSQSFVKF